MALDDDEDFVPSSTYEPLTLRTIPLTVAEVLRTFNAKRCYFDGNCTQVNWTRTDVWLQKDMHHLPTPPSGYEYAFNAEKHLVELIASSDPSVARTRRSEGTYTQDPRAVIRSGVAEALRHRQEMQQAISQTHKILPRK